MLDINQQIVSDLPIQIPETTVKWLTYALVLNIVALISSAIATFFGLLAHLREISRSSGTTLTSGLSSTAAFFALAFNIAFTLFARNRVKAVPGSSVTIGNALWLSLAAWLLLSIGTCFYTIGRRCIQGRPAKVPELSMENRNNDPTRRRSTRLTRRSETGLPPFQELSNAQRVEEEPKLAYIDGDAVVTQAPCKLLCHKELNRISQIC
jgi:hypothetical protein